MMKRSTIIEIIIFLYAILFTYTGISKLMDFTAFRESVAESPILAPVATIIAILLPWVEFFVVAMMIIPRWRLKGLYTCLILMTSFTGYVIGILLYDEHLPCSCGGILQQLSWPQHLIINGIFILLAIGAILLQKRQKKENDNHWILNKYRTTN